MSPGRRFWLGFCTALAILLVPPEIGPARRSAQWVLWAWERPEDLRLAPASVEIAVQTAFIELAGSRLRVRGRPHPLRAWPGQVTTAVVHVQVDRRVALDWTPERRAELAAVVLDFARPAWVRRLQVDFEVRASERAVLLEVLSAVRSGLRPGVALSMTALVSWCEGERWLDDAPVDEIVPMVFRMGPEGDALKARLAAGGDFRNPRCRTALGIATDEPLDEWPAGRRVYVFNPRSWSIADFESLERR